MKRVFITGMGRSGTSLLDKLLCIHPEIDILSQPFPLVFAEAKRRFLEMTGINAYYVHNDDKISRRYPEAAITAYLARLQMSADEVDQLFEKMAGYSGQKSKPDRKPERPVTESLDGFGEILEYCFQHFALDPMVTFNGMKEIMCDEFLPYLGTVGYKCIVIVRDPRDVLASANYPAEERFLGAKKPTLFLLRAWRKSVEFTWILRREPSLHCLRYEDLVRNPLSELDRIADFLEIGPFDSSWFGCGIRDRAGNPWQANSSSGIRSAEISSASIGIHRGSLSAAEIEYTEAVCSHEMTWLDYRFGCDIDRTACIRSFKDFEIEETPHLCADFSSRPEHVAQEIRRLQDFKGFYSCQ